MKRRARMIGLVSGMVALLIATHGRQILAADPPDKNSPTWESEIRAFEKSDRTNPPPAKCFLFVGSSSIRLWKSLEKDFAGLPVAGRGFGGSQIADSTHFADRIILPYKPRMVLVYAGDNDLAAMKTPEQVLADFQALVGKIRAQLPETEMAYIAIKPSLARWHLVERIKAANNLIKAWSGQEARLHFIDIYMPMLDSDGKPREELFVKDGLHLNSRGYEVWTAAIKPYLK